MRTTRDSFIEYWTEENGSPPPSKWAICSHCRGEGTSTRHLGAYTQSDREEMGDEWYDFMDDVRAGVYDQPCEECGGSGKVREFTGEAETAWFDWLQDEYDDRRTRMQESGIYGGDW